MLNLPDVTLVMIETLEHELASLAIKDCLRKANFGKILIFTDDPAKIGWYQGAQYVSVPVWPNKLGWSNCCWNGPAQLLSTTHALFIQWDAWIFDETKWRDEWLQYDYIGAPWWYEDGKNVGNGGFSLRSTRLCRYVHVHRDRFPCTTHLDDDLLCRKYRPSLEAAEGFEWAPECVAQNFSFEATRPGPDSRHFGFHAAWNFGEVLNREEMLQRTKLMLASPYIQKTGHIWNTFKQRYPDVIAAV